VNRGQGAQLCTSCRKLVSADEKVCHHCGAVNPTLWGFGRSLRKLFGGEVDISKILIGVCITLYAVTLLFDPVAAFSASGGLMNMGSPDYKGLYLFGMTGSVAWSCGHFWTLLTANFLHGSLLHLLFNVMWMRSLGEMATSLLGPARFFIVFILTGVGGFLTSVIFSPAPTMGASAAIFGLMGVLIGFGRRRGGELGSTLNQQMLMWAGIGLVFGLSVPNVNNYAHVGGFITGLGMAWLLPKREGQTQGRGVMLLAFVLAVLTVASFGLSITNMWSPVFEGGNVCTR
jgi:rhomboid protease GluP